MSIVRNDDGTYTLNWLDRLFGVHIRELADVWVPLPSSEGGGAQIFSDAAGGCGASTAAGDASSERCFGWIMGGLPAPSKGDRYIIEFVNAAKTTFRVLAYMDRFGRVFSTDEAVVAPPAREPDVAFARFVNADAAKNDEAGCVQVRLAQGGSRQVAQYRCHQDYYRLFDTWYNFGAHSNRLNYADALTRCYVAFVHRPEQGARPVPTRDFVLVRDALRDKQPLAAMEHIANEVREARRDSALQPPALISCLADWLQEAGLDRVLAVVREAAGPKAEPLRLVRTARYANTYYLGIDDEETAAILDERDIWALEAALNRFLLVGDSFGKTASLALAGECAWHDEELFAHIAMQAPDAGATEDAQGDPAGEWQVRVCVGQAMERLRLPVRFVATFKADVESGVVAFDVTAPDASLMPAMSWDAESGAWKKADEEARRTKALHYAQQLGVALAAAAFHSSRLVSAVIVRACPLAPPAESGEAKGRGATPFYRVLFDRETFCHDDAYRRAAEGDPTPLYAAHGALFGDQAQGDPFEVVEHMGSARVRRDAPEGMTIRFDEKAAEALGARSTHDLRIYYEGILRHTGETLADCVVGSANVTEAIRYVRAAQDDADDPRVVEACTHLMTALVEGTVDATDQNALVTCFIGEDRYHRALMQARAVASHDASAAVSILRTVIAEAEGSGKFADNAETVHRV
ncbi:MAG: hypothetical protein IJC51_05440, partial [Eggerthellaceae bacterium]|nr:hypothetical protein [Eggerthellaceae bacterium]